MIYNDDKQIFDNIYYEPVFYFIDILLIFINGY